jgi:hypothetical protein
MKLDARSDAIMLESACVNYARAVQADAMIQRGCQVEEPIINHTTGKVIGTKIKNHPRHASCACGTNGEKGTGLKGLGRKLYSTNYRISAK